MRAEPHLHSGLRCQGGSDPLGRGETGLSRPKAACHAPPSWVLLASSVLPQQSPVLSQKGAPTHSSTQVPHPVLYSSRKCSCDAPLGVYTPNKPPSPLRLSAFLMCTSPASSVLRRGHPFPHPGCRERETPWASLVWLWRMLLGCGWMGDPRKSPGSLRGWELRTHQTLAPQHLTGCGPQ